jgi:hypothetical protein
MSRIEYKVLRCRSITELEEQINYYESNGWSRAGRAGRTDAFDGMHVHTIGIVKEIDETEEITRTLD